MGTTRLWFADRKKRGEYYLRELDKKRFFVVGRGCLNGRWYLDIEMRAPMVWF